MSKKFEIEKSKFKGHDMVSVWLLDEHGERKGYKPYFNFSQKKFDFLFENIDELKEKINGHECVDY